MGPHKTIPARITSYGIELPRHSTGKCPLGHAHLYYTARAGSRQTANTSLFALTVAPLPFDDESTDGAPGAVRVSCSCV